MTRIVFFLLPILLPFVGLSQQAREFAPCPKSPNCVSTMAPDSDKRHFFPLYTYENLGWEEACTLAEKVLQQMKGMTMITQAPGYFKAEYRVRLFGFIDDFEIWLPQDERVIHLRSASRVGYSDLGANRARAIAFIRRFRNQIKP